MDLGLDGRVAIVTAASKGLGRATAQALAAEGPRVLLTARNQAALEELGATMDDALVVPGDITDPALPGQLVDAAVQRWGRIDIVVGNAGGPPSGSALDVDDEHILAAVERQHARLRAGGPCPGAAHAPATVGRVVFIASASVRQPIRDLALVRRRPHRPGGMDKDRRPGPRRNFINGIELGIDGGAVTELM